VIAGVPSRTDQAQPRPGSGKTGPSGLGPAETSHNATTSFASLLAAVSPHSGARRQGHAMEEDAPKQPGGQRAKGDKAKAPKNSASQDGGAVLPVQVPRQGGSLVAGPVPVPIATPATVARAAVRAVAVQDGTGNKPTALVHTYETAAPPSTPVAHEPGPAPAQVTTVPLAAGGSQQDHGTTAPRAMGAGDVVLPPVRWAHATKLQSYGGDASQAAGPSADGRHPSLSVQPDTSPGGKAPSNEDSQNSLPTRTALAEPSQRNEATTYNRARSSAPPHEVTAPIKPRSQGQLDPALTTGPVGTKETSSEPQQPPPGVISAGADLGPAPSPHPTDGHASGRVGAHLVNKTGAAEATSPGGASRGAKAGSEVLADGPGGGPTQGQYRSDSGSAASQPGHPVVESPGLSSGPGPLHIQSEAAPPQPGQGQIGRQGAGDLTAPSQHGAAHAPPPGTAAQPQATSAPTPFIRQTPTWPGPTVASQVSEAVIGHMASVPAPSRATDGTWSVSVHLDPPELGQVQATLTLGPNGLEVLLVPSTSLAQQALQQASRQIAQSIGGNAPVSVSVHNPGAQAGNDGRQAPRQAPLPATVRNGLGSAATRRSQMPPVEEEDGTYIRV
jgi:hypothetical protein